MNRTSAIGAHSRPSSRRGGTGAAPTAACGTRRGERPVLARPRVWREPAATVALKALGSSPGPPSTLSEARAGSAAKDQHLPAAWPPNSGSPRRSSVNLGVFVCLVSRPRRGAHADAVFTGRTRKFSMPCMPLCLPPRRPAPASPPPQTCSGIHRGLGVHISQVGRVKDLGSISAWGGGVAARGSFRPSGRHGRAGRP
jgi:hypothetical protein